MVPAKTEVGASAAEGAVAEGVSFDLPAIAAPETQPAARLIVGPPLPEFLARGLAIIQYRAENLRILPVFGPRCPGRETRVGHVHVTVYDAIIVQGLSPGLHRIRIDLADPTHPVIDSR